MLSRTIGTIKSRRWTLLTTIWFMFNGVKAYIHWVEMKHPTGLAIGTWKESVLVPFLVPLISINPSNKGQHDIRAKSHYIHMLVELLIVPIKTNKPFIIGLLWWLVSAEAWSFARRRLVQSLRHLSLYYYGRIKVACPLCLREGGC